MEALVRIIDRSAAEDDSKRGDVICVQPDGWAWSEAERTNPDWLIIKVTGLLNTDRDTMHATGRNFPQGRVRRREWHLDLDNAPLPARFRHPRKAESVTITRAVAASMLKAKPAMT